MAAQAIIGSYQPRQVGTPADELRRVGLGVGLLLGAVALAIVLSNADSARHSLLIGCPVAIVSLLVGRLGIRVYVTNKRRQGAWSERILAVGSSDAVSHLTTRLRRNPTAGMTVVAACVDSRGTLDTVDVPVLGGWDDAIRIAEIVGADAVALVGGQRGALEIREMGLALEESGRHLLTSLEIENVARSRIRVTEVDGMPLAWIKHADAARFQPLLKRGFDLATSAVLLVMLSPLLITIAAVVRLTSTGPAIFKQERLGKGGKPFRVWKFRTMVANAESLQEELLALNESDDLLYFKIRQDPRITRVGALLRRSSLDELPQLFNILFGTMSIVGPRPLPGDLPASVQEYRRRLLVKPGLTGLWQVSGRSDLSVADALRLDVYYVENWTFGLDVAILLRTVGAVIRSEGAY